MTTFTWEALVSIFDKDLTSLGPAVNAGPDFILRMQTASASKTCLLLEDDPDDQEFFMQTLQAVSAQTGCYAVTNGEEALRVLKSRGIIPDYIFTDIQMPRMDGMEFLQRIKASRELRDIPVVVYSSTWSEQMVIKVKELGAIAFYSKERFKVLPDILRQYFGGARSLPVD